MDNALSIAASSIAATTTEIGVTSENIANAQTPGYVAQRAVLAPQPGGDAFGTGSGVVVTSVAQLSNALLSANNLQAQGSLQNLSASQQVLTAIQNVFPLGQSQAATSSSPTGSANSSIAGQLADFWSSWDSIAQDPSGSAPRTQVIDQAKGLATSLNEAAGQLDQLSANTASELKGQLAQVDTLLGQAAQLNGQITATAGGGGSANQLVDQLNQVVGQLGQLAGVSVRAQADGTALVNIGGVAVVQGDQATPLSLTSTTDPTTGQAITAIQTSSDGTPVTVTGGSIAGLLDGINNTIPQYKGELNTVANNLAGAVNGQLAQGYTAPGVPQPADDGAPAPPATEGLSGANLPLFAANGGGTVTAGSIMVNPDLAANPALIAAASAAANTAGAGANDGANAQAMAELANATTNSPDASYQKLVEDIGSQTQNVNSQVTSQTTVANQAQQALQAATGVDQNTELTNLMQFQSAYQASAKLVSVIDTTIQSLLQAV